MNIPKWLLISLGVVVAGAVGVAAVLIGMRFAPPPPASSYASPDTMTVPVLAPVELSTSQLDDDGSATPTPDATDGGDAGGDSDSGDASDGIPISDTVGEREVVVPDTDPVPGPVDPETLHLIDIVGLAPGLLPDLGLIGIGDRDDDPCAPEDGDPPGDCPAGAPGAIFFDDDLPPLWLTAGAFPPNTLPRDGIPSRDLSPLICSTEDDPGNGEVPFRIRVTAPGTWTVQYWPVDDPSNVQTLAPIVATPAQGDRWMSETRPGGYPIIEHCGLMTGLEPNTVYTAVISGRDTLDREPGSATITFNSDGAPVHPGLRVQTIGDNLLVGAALHKSDENVVIHAYVVGNDTEPSCDPSDDHMLATLTAVQDVAVGEAERLQLRAPDGFDKKDVVSFRVPEGSTVLVCARWFPDESADVPPWESDLATFDSTVVVQAPDHLIPKVELVGFTPRDSRTTTLNMHVSSTEGTDCGLTRWESDGGVSVPLTICDPFFLSDGTAGTEDGRLYDRGFPSDLVMSIDAELSSGETSETTALLPAGAGGCVGTCVAPPPQVYTLASIGGAVDIRVSWEQGLQNGRGGWGISSVLDTPHDTPRHDAPRIDPRIEWTIQFFGFSHPYAAARMNVPVDREVDYTLTFYDNRTREIGVSCDDGSPLVARGHAETLLRLDMNGVCFGTNYSAVLELDGVDGSSSLWNQNYTADTYWLAGNLVFVGGLPVEARYQVYYQTSSSRYLNQWDLTINGVRQNLIGSGLRDGRCSPDGIYQSLGAFDTTLRNDTYVSLDTVTDARSGVFTDCASQRTGRPFIEPQILARPTWEELTSATGIEIYVPESGARIRLYFSPR